jgi:NDP-sugar pyrophosphorylase family protein
VQRVDGAVFDSVPPGAPASSIGGVYDALLAARPDAVRGLVCDAAFWDVGTVDDYWRTSEAFRAKGGTATTGRGGRVDAAARVTRSILWDDVVVEADAVVDECIVTDGVRVPAGASYRRVVLVANDEGDQPAASPLDV